MGVYMINNFVDVNNSFDYEIFHEHIIRGVYCAELTGTATVPARTVEQFHWIWLKAEAGEYLYRKNRPYIIEAMNPSIEVLPAGQEPTDGIARVIGAWGTTPGSTELMRQMQTDRVVWYNGSYTFDDDIGERSTPDPPGGFTANTEQERPTHGAWPPGLCCAVYIRAEAWRESGGDDYDGAGTLPNLGLSQVNIIGVDGVTGGGGPQTLGFITQAKAFGQVQQGGQNSQDGMRVVIGPGANTWWVRAGSGSRGFIMVRGYELMPTLGIGRGDSRARVSSTFVSKANSGTDATAYTFTAQGIGTAAHDRDVIVAVYGIAGAEGRTIASVTIGGVTATEIVQNTNSLTNCAVVGLYRLRVATGTTADIVVTFSGAMVRAGIGVYNLFNHLNGAAFDTAIADANSATVTIPARGTIIAVYGSNSNITHTWQSLFKGTAYHGATQDWDDVVEALTSYTGAHVNGNSTQKVTMAVTPSSAATLPALAVASWGPITEGSDEQ